MSNRKSLKNRSNRRIMENLIGENVLNAETDGIRMLPGTSRKKVFSAKNVPVDRIAATDRKKRNKFYA